MSVQIVRRGFDLRLTGALPKDPPPPETRVPARFAVLGADYPGMRPAMRVGVGDSVSRGAVLFEDRKTPGVRFTAPLAGRVAAIHRGERRAFRALVIETASEERSGRPGRARSFRGAAGRHPERMTADAVRELLLDSGAWTAIRSRPFGRVANPERRPAALFVTAADTAPLAPDPARAVAGRDDDLAWGLAALAHLTDGPVFVCSRAGRRLPVPDKDRIRQIEFAGPHPAGTAGLHIHRLAPARRDREAWYLDAQDLAAVGALFRTGSLDPLRVVALAGPPLARPLLLRTPLGADALDLARAELRRGGETAIRPGHEDPADRCRVISGSVLSGRAAQEDHGRFLGRYHRQITVLEEARRRRLLGWLGPGLGALSASRAFLPGVRPGRGHAPDTDSHGSRRAIVPTGAYERVMAFDIPPVFLLRALLMEDLERAEELGALELVEEDLGLLSFVCPAKNDYAPQLRRVLDALEREG